MKKNSSHILKSLSPARLPQVKPLADRVLIKEIDEKDQGHETASGIFIPETVESDKGAKKGRVVALGEGRHEDGKIIPMKVKIGDTVLFQWGDKLKIEGEEYYIAKESEIMAIIK